MITLISRGPLLELKHRLLHPNTLIQILWLQNDLLTQNWPIDFHRLANFLVLAFFLFFSDYILNIWLHFSHSSIFFWRYRPLHRLPEIAVTDVHVMFILHNNILINLNLLDLRENSGRVILYCLLGNVLFRIVRLFLRTVTLNFAIWRRVIIFSQFWINE